MTGDLPEPIRRAAELERQAVEWYASVGPLRAAVASIPVVGTAIDALAGTRGQSIAQQRLLATVEVLQEEFADLRQELEEQSQEAREFKEQLVGDYLESEEFFDLAARMFEHGRRTRDRERLRAYARIMRKAVVEPGFRGSADTCLDVIASLSPEEFHFALLVWHSYQANPLLQWRSGFDVATLESAGVPTSFTTLSSLEFKGVVRRSTEVDNRQLSRAMAHMLDGFSGWGSMTEERYHFTPVFARALKMLGDLIPEDETEAPDPTEASEAAG